MRIRGGKPCSSWKSFIKRRQSAANKKTLAAVEEQLSAHRRQQIDVGENY
jgi:hypothetical protein